MSESPESKIVIVEHLWNLPQAVPILLLNYQAKYYFPYKDELGTLSNENNNKFLIFLHLGNYLIILLI